MKNFKPKKLPKDDLEIQIKVWEKTIEVQMHFNELQMKIRNFAILLVSALVGAAGIALKDGLTVDHTFFWIHFQGSLSSVFFGAAALVWLVFFFMDHNWYYPLLLGAVKHGAAIETALKERVPQIGLTKRIGEESPRKIFNITLRSKDKSFIFYTTIFILLVALAVGSSWVPKPNRGGTGGGFLVEKNPATSGVSNIPIPTPAATTTVPATAPAQPSGATVILNQQLYNGTMPSTKVQAAPLNSAPSPSKHHISKCISPKPVCTQQPEDIQK